MFHPLWLQTFAKVSFLEIRWTWWSRILCLKIEHFTFHLAPYRQGIILPHRRSEMKGDLSFAICLYPLLSLWHRGPLSFLTRFRSGGILIMRKHHCRLFMWSGQHLHFAGNVALPMTVWLLLPKNMGLNVLLLQQNGVCNPEQKDGALNLSFAKPLELQVHGSVALQMAPAALSVSWDTSEVCSCSCLRAPQVHAEEPERGRGEGYCSRLPSAPTRKAESD